MATRVHQWVHLLSVYGASVDYALIDEVLSTVDHYHLGGHCWLIQSLQDRDQFFARIRQTLPKESGTHECLFCPVSGELFLDSTSVGDTQNLNDWIRKQGLEDILKGNQFL